jgi:hypothetical protein
MRLKITGGFLEVEVVEGSGNIDDVRLILKKLSLTPEEQIKYAGAKVSPSSSKSNMQGKLNARPRMPI